MRFIADLLGRLLRNVGQPTIWSELQSHRPGIRSEHRSGRMHPYKAFAPIGVGYDLIGLTEQTDHLRFSHADL